MSFAKDSERKLLIAGSADFLCGPCVKKLNAKNAMSLAKDAKKEQLLIAELCGFSLRTLR